MTETRAKPQPVARRGAPGNVDAGAIDGSQHSTHRQHTQAASLSSWHEQDRERALAELRVARLEHQLAVAHIDHLGLLLRDNLIAPWGARVAVADLHVDTAEGGEQ